MNKTFKVVYNKARGMLTAVNEAASCVQAKGTKTVVAAAAIAALSGAVQAADSNLAEGVSITPVYGAGAYVGDEGFVSTSKKVAIEQTDKNTWKVIADGFGAEEDAIYGAAVNNSTDAYAHGVDEVHIADGSSFKNNKAQYGAGLIIFQEGAGGANPASAHENTITGTTFEGNEATDNGGALALMANGSLQAKDGTTTISGSTFSDNKAGELGGAIYVEGTDLVVTGGTTFKGNSSKEYGGAIYVHSVATGLQINGATFTENSSGRGGAVMLWSDGRTAGDQQFAISKATFKGNTATTKGGAIAWLQMEAVAKEGQTLTVSDSTFDGNKAQNGGAIYAEEELIVKGTTVFENNKAGSMGGAIMNTGDNAEMTIGNGVVFKNNTAATSGAIHNAFSKGMTIGNGAQFIGNSATSYAGAVYNHDSTLTIGNDLLVQGNKSGEGHSAGAFANDENGVITIGDNAKFIDNESGKSGGALYQYITADRKGGSYITLGKNALFEGNKASVNGGAVAVYNANSSSSTITFGDGVSFKNNTAGGQGGAVYVAAGNGIVFEGSATFSGNIAGNAKNDIHNDGTVTVKSGTLSIDGGITGTGTISFADRSSLNVTIGTDQASSTTIANKVSITDSANLSMTFAPGYEGTYTIFGAGGAYAEGSESFTLVDNVVFDVTEDAENKGFYAISLKDASEIAAGTGADSNQAAAIEAIMSKEGGSESFKAVAEAISTGLQSQDAGAKQAALDAVTAMSPEAAPMVTQVSTDTAAQVFRVVGNRLGGAQGMSSGDGTSGTALWVQGMVGATDMESTGTARGYSSDSNGFALGLEAKPTQDTTLGMGFAYTNTDVDGFLRTADVDTMTAFVYGEYKPADWYVNGILSYAWSNYDEDRSVAGTAVTADYDADTFGLQVTGGHNFNVAGYAVTPEVGLRYFHLNTDGYTDSLGTSVADSDNDVLTGVAGVRFAKDFEVSPAFTVKPELRLAATYDIVDADNQSFVTIANGSSYSVDGETLDRFGFEAGVGVTAQMGDNFEMALSYEGSWRGDFQNHAGLINAKYKF